MRHPAGITHTTSLSTTPREGRDRPSLFLRLIAWVLMATISTSSFAQAVGPMNRGSYGQPYTGFTKNGTFVQGGVVVGNPHQEQHDLLKPGLWTTAAASFTNSTDPSFIQSNLADIEASIAVTPEPGGRAMSRLYITIPPAAPTANPYLDPSAGAPGCDPATTCNQAIYNQLLLDAQANGYSSVGNDGLGASTHIAKTHDSSSDSIYNRGFGSYQTKPVFQAAENPEGGATAFFLLQDAAAASHLRVLQNQSVANLGGLIFYTQQTLKGPGTGLVSRGYDGEVYDPGAEFDRQVGSAPSSFNRDSNNGSRGLTGYQVNPNGPGSDFQIGYIQPDGQAHAFDLVKDPHFRAFQNSAGYGAGEWGSDLNAGNPNNPNNLNNALLGANLRTAAIQNQKGQQAVANLSFEWAQDDRALFYQGINLYNYGNKADNALLRQLELGQITAGSADYVRARALAEQRFKEAYAAQVEYELKAKFTKEGAKYQAGQLNFDGFDADKLFNSGLNLFDKKGDPEQERLLRELKAGNLKPGDARYDEIRGLAEARYRVAYQKALEPPKKANPLKQLVAVVIAAVVVYFTAGAASGWVATGISGATATSATGAVVVAGTAGTAATVGGVAATAIGSAVGAYAGAVVGAGIQTGSMSKALAAGENSLKGGIANIVVSTALAATGLSASGLGSALNVSDKVGQAVLNTMTSSLSQTIAYGGSLGDNLVNSAINNGVNVISANVANQIGDANLNGLDGFSTELAHGALGCASAVARGGNTESCGAGAAGAIAGHMSAEGIKTALADTKEPGLLANMFAAVPGKTLNDNVIFLSGLVGGSVASVTGGSNNVQSNFNVGQTTAQNAVENNYLKHEEAKKLQALKDKEFIGQCDGNCKAEISRLNEVDEARNQELAACQGSSTPKCQQAYKEVRVAAAEYIRTEKFADSLQFSFQGEKAETLGLAKGTTDGKLNGAAQGAWEAVKEAGKGAMDAGKTLFAAASGDKQAWESIKQGAGGMVDYVTEPSNWPYLLGVMTPEDREKLAQAYESGNGNEIGSLMANQVANLPIGGGPVGSIKRIDNAIDAAQDAAKLANKVDGPGLGKGVGANGGVNLARVEVDVAKATKGSPEYNILNAPPPNSQVKLSNGTEFKTNPSGYVDEVTYSPSLSQGVRDARQTAVGKEGLSTDVGGHVQACSLGGTCDRFNLFPQDGNFNNSGYKRWENEIKGALNNGDQVGPVTVRFNRTDPASARPDSLIIDYSVNGVPKQRFFENKAGK